MIPLMLRSLAAPVALLIALAGVVYISHSSGKQSGMATTQARWDVERLASQTARASQESKNRQIEQELSDASEIHAEEVSAVHAARTADRVAGAAVAGRLRDAARATAELARQASADAASTEVRAAAADAARMLADLRERADEAAGILALAADNAQFAGAACQRRYNEVREALSR